LFKLNTKEEMLFWQPWEDSLCLVYKKWEKGVSVSVLFRKDKHEKKFASFLIFSDGEKIVFVEQMPEDAFCWIDTNGDGIFDCVGRIGCAEEKILFENLVIEKSPKKATEE